MRGSKKAILILSTLFIGIQLFGCSKTESPENITKEEGSISNNINSEENVNQKESNKVDLLNEITPKLKTVEEIENVKKDVNGKFKEILGKNNFSITHATPNNGFVISESPYNKYTKDYEQTLYSLLSENYTDGTVEVRMIAKKDFHKDDEITESDDFVKCLYDIYTYTSKEEITLQDFVSKVKDGVSTDQAKIELGNFISEPYIYLQVNNVDSSTKQLEFKFHAFINDTLKRKYHKKEYETVNIYQEDTKALKSKALEIVKKNQAELANIEYNLHRVSDVKVNAGQNKFMQTGSIITYGGESFGTSSVPKFEEHEVNELVNTYKLILGSELEDKVDFSQLTVENLNKLVESQIIINTYANKYELPNVDMYIDNATVELTNGGTLLEEDDGLNWTFATENHYADIYIKYSIPVIAEGITEI